MVNRNLKRVYRVKQEFIGKRNETLVGRRFKILDAAVDQQRLNSISSLALLKTQTILL